MLRHVEEWEAMLIGDDDSQDVRIRIGNRGSASEWRVRGVCRRTEDADA
jgi:hypothetical protein